MRSSTQILLKKQKNEQFDNELVLKSSNIAAASDGQNANFRASSLVQSLVSPPMPCSAIPGASPAQLVSLKPDNEDQTVSGNHARSLTL